MFELFRALPPELRLKIWDHVSRERRIIEVQHNGDRLLETVASDTGFSFIAPVPPLLHACRESRAVGLRRYELALKSVVNYAHARQASRVYISFPQDTIYLVDEVFDTVDLFVNFCRRAGNDLERIEYLAVNSFSWDSHCYYELEQGDSKVMGVLSPFKALKKVTIALERPQDCGYGYGPSNSRSGILAFVEPPPAVRVVRGWKFLPETVEGIIDLLARSWLEHAASSTDDPVLPWRGSMNIMGVQRNPDKMVESRFDSPVPILLSR